MNELLQDYLGEDKRLVSYEKALEGFTAHYRYIDDDTYLHDVDILLEDILVFLYNRKAV